MFSSKKILYFIIVAMVVICYVNGIDFRANTYEVTQQTTESFVDFSDSGFFAITDSGQGLSTVAEIGEGGGAAVDEYSGGVAVIEDGNGQQNNGQDIEQDPAQQITDNQQTEQTTVMTTVPSVIPSNVAPVQPQQPQQPQQPAAPATTTTTTTTTRTTTTTTTTRTTTTTTTTAFNYSDSGGIHFAYNQVTIYAGASTTINLNVPIGSQRRATFSSKNTMVATASNYGDTVVEITGVSVGETWIQATNSAGDVAYCKVIVTDFAREVIRLTNNERAAYGLPALREGDALVQRMADIRLSESSIYFNHTRPNNQRFSTVAQEIGLSYRYIGENLARGQTSPAQVVQEWMASPTHRNNILNTNYTYLCVSYGIGADGYPYWVQIFHNPS